MAEFEKFVLPSGLKIVLVPMPEATVVSTVIYAKGGSRFETNKEAGIAHLKEHLFFKAGGKYPNTFVLSVACDSVGAIRNAATTEEFVFYYIKHAAHNSYFGLDILCDMMLHNIFNEEEFETEKQVVFKEMIKRSDNPNIALYEATQSALLYGPHELGRKIIGTKETVESLTRSDLDRYSETFYRPNNLVVSVAGKIDAAGANQKIQRLFGHTPAAPIPEWREFNPATMMPDNRFYFHDLNGRQEVLFRLIAPGPGYFGENEIDSCAVEVLVNILGAGMSSRLFNEARVKRGLVYGIRIDRDEFKEAGMIDCHWGTDVGSAVKSVNVVINEYDRICDEYVNDDELAKVRGMIRGRSEMAREDSMYVAMAYGQQESTEGKIVSFDERLEMIDSISAQDVQRVARMYLKKDNLKLAMAANENFPHRTEIEEIITGAR